MVAKDYDMFKTKLAAITVFSNVFFLGEKCNLSKKCMYTITPELDSTGLWMSKWIWT